MKHVILALVLATGCSDDGKAPAIASLTYSPMSITALQQSTVTGTFTFTDDDGNAEKLGIDVTLPDNSLQELPPTKLQNVDGMTSGTIGFSVIITPPMAGAYKFAIYIVDGDDNESNDLTGTLTAN